VSDLARALGNKRRLSVVNTAEGADIVIEVESRDSHWDTGGVYAYKPRKGGNTTYFTTTKKVRTVYATLKVEDYSHQFHGEAALWSAAAGRVADQIDKWVEQNLVKLIELRQHRQ
jgi:hypothetical protein